MVKKNYKTNDDYILDVLQDEEEKLLDKLGEILPEETKYLFYKYLAIKETIQKLSKSIA